MLPRLQRRLVQSRASAGEPLRALAEVLGISTWQAAMAARDGLELLRAHLGALPHDLTRNPEAFMETATREALALPRRRRDSADAPKMIPDRAAAAALITSRLHASFVEMTVPLALALLERNGQNRALRKKRIELYATDINAGEWHPNNQGIGLGVDGVVYDGQHRLWAVVKALRTVPMLVVSGLPAATRSTIDQLAARSLGEALRIDTEQPAAERVAAWLRAIELLVTKTRVSMSPAIAKRQRARYLSTIDWFVTNGPRRRPYDRAPIIGALVYAHRVAAAHVEPFARGYISGVDLPGGSPALALRAYVAEGMQADRHVPRAAMLKTLGCLLASIRGETLERVPHSEEGFEHFRRLQ